MRKNIFVLLALGITALMLSQTLPLNKQKNETDTIKKNKTAIDQSEIQDDSTIIAPLQWNPYKKSVMASYYANKFNGRRTASGKRFSNSAYTAAHKKLPFGTIVKVTNEANGQFVIVEVTDRGPFVRSKEIDLSKRAFMEIAQNKKSGIMKVTLEILEL
jgi:rare lipoprotein A